MEYIMFSCLRVCSSSCIKHCPCLTQSLLRFHFCIRLPNMALPSSALSKTLQSITIIKIGELEKQRNSFAHRKAEILNAAEDAGNDHRERVRSLLPAVKELDPSVSYDRSLLNIRPGLINPSSTYHSPMR
jgi:hypothetical protein